MKCFVANHILEPRDPLVYQCRLLSKSESKSEWYFPLVSLTRARKPTSPPCTPNETASTKFGRYCYSWREWLVVFYVRQKYCDDLSCFSNFYGYIDCFQRPRYKIWKLFLLSERGFVRTAKISQWFEWFFKSVRLSIVFRAKHSVMVMLKPFSSPNNDTINTVYFYPLLWYSVPAGKSAVSFSWEYVNEADFASTFVRELLKKIFRIWVLIECVH